MEKDETNALIKKYEETGKLLNTFFEWRYKIMNRFFLGIAAVFISIQWMYTSDIKQLIYIPLLLGGVFSFLSSLMDKVNQNIINNCYKVGYETEDKLFSSEGIYSNLSNDFYFKKTRKFVSYRVILQILYILSGILLLISSSIAYMKLAKLS